jgi:hypothetical protein
VLKISTAIEFKIIFAFISVNTSFIHLCAQILSKIYIYICHIILMN